MGPTGFDPSAPYGFRAGRPRLVVERPFFRRIWNCRSRGAGTEWDNFAWIRKWQGARRGGIVGALSFEDRPMPYRYPSGRGGGWGRLEVILRRNG